MLVGKFNAVKVESVPLKFGEFPTNCGPRRATPPTAASRPPTSPLATFLSHHATEGRSMSGNWGSVLIELIPLALVVALSPLSIIPAVLVLHTPRPRPTGLAFLAGWLVGLFGTDRHLRRGGRSARRSGQGAEVGGVAAHRRRRRIDRVRDIRWVTRHRSAHTPGWMRSLTNVTPARAAVTAAALVVVNPKVLFICAAAGLAIGTAGLGATGAWLAVVWYRRCSPRRRSPFRCSPTSCSPTTWNARCPGSRSGWSDTTPHWSR